MKFFLLFILSTPLYASARVSFSVAQSLVDDWKQGKAVIFELNQSLAFSHNFKIDTLLFVPTFRYAIGVQYTNLTSQKINYIVPTDNELFGEAMLKYPAGWILDPFFAANFRTQITESFAVVKGSKQPTAKLWDPVVSMQSFGFAHTLSDSSRRRILTNRLGVSLKQTRTQHYTAMSDDPKTKERERWKAEAGLEWKLETTLKVANNLTYTATMETFASLKTLQQSTFRMQNELRVAIWKVVGITIRVELQYDQRQKQGIQYRQNLRAGVNGEV
jgi:hypothetical protein